ncbi:hypothetical protein HYX13_01215 [Candidatus Woesearchaeota archaeon]|nr:hypothetical protein [Candidatus Woesearchaeota archaeon]
MNTLRGIRTAAYAALLSLLPANCGDISTCKSDLDCKESRICQYDSNEDASFCMTPEEAEQSREDAQYQNNTCGNSELTNTYLWNVYKEGIIGCSLGTREPLQQDCTGALIGSFGGLSEQDIADEQINFTYFGNTLQLHYEERNRPLTLVHNPTAADFPVFEECYANRLGDEDENYWRAIWNTVVNQFLCSFTYDPSLFWGKTDDPCDVWAWKKTLEPWKGSRDCSETERTKPYHSECLEQFPIPSPEDF